MSSIDLKGFIRPHLREIETFSPADPPELQAKKAGITEEEIVRLNANENPYGFSPKVAEAVASVPYNIYPDPFQRKVRAALSEFTGVPAERIIAGAGSDEIIDLIFRLVIEPGDKIIDSEPTFGMYSFDARVNGAETVMVQRDENFDVDVDAVKDAIDERAKIIFLCSPNNPTGNVATPEQIEGLVETGLLVVIDEAYWEFSGSTAASMVADHDNLIVLRTMSKWAGIAGLRIGYGIMSPTLVNHIIDIKQPYNVTTASEAALMATLEDADYLERKPRPDRQRARAADYACSTASLELSRGRRVGTTSFASFSLVAPRRYLKRWRCGVSSCGSSAPSACAISSGYPSGHQATPTPSWPALQEFV